MSGWITSRHTLAGPALLHVSPRATFFIFFALLILPITSRAAPCESIIAPSNFNDFDSPLVTIPIEDCADPFEETKDVDSPYTVVIDEVDIADGGTHTVPEGGTTNYRIEGDTLLSYASILFFIHDGDVYRYIDTRLSEPSEAEYRSYAQAFFDPGTDIEPYIATILSGDFYSGDFDMQQRLYAFMSYVEAQYEPQLPPLRAGTYTVVIKEEEITLASHTESFWQRLLAMMATPAHAQFIPRSYTFTTTFTLTEVEEPVGGSSILFLPGIQASRLYKKNFIGNEDRLWEPNINQDFRQLEMTAAGESIESVYTRDIIDEIFGVVDIYEGFDRFLTGLVSDAVIENWKAYAYDWRYSVIDIAERGTQYENEIRSALTEIEVLAEDSFSGKVTIIGHSNGGLLAKAIMERLAAQGKTALVDRVIFIGTPQLGTPKAIPTILHGYDQGAAGGLIINEATVRDIVGSMPGALALVPSQKYFDEDPGLLVTFDTSDSTAFLRTAYGNAINNESELLAFMRGEDGRPANPESIEEPVIANGTLLEEVLEDHARLFDVWSAPEGVEVIEVVGVGLNTLRGIEYREFVTRECTNEGFQGQQCVDIPYYKAIPQFTQYGDGTVVGYSAEGYEGEKRRFYFDLKRSRQLGEIVEHANITNASFLQRLIANVISNEDSTVEAISESLPEFVTDTILIGVHSPLNIIVTDGRGNTIERGAGDYPIESIGGGEYLEFAGGKYVLIPKDGEYDIKLEGTGTGSATFTLESLEGDSRKTLVDVRIATITPNTTIAAEYSEVGLSNLSIDQDGDGDIDIEMTPAGEIINTSVSYDDLLKGIAALPLRNVQKNILIAQVRIAAELEKLAVKKPKLAKLEIVALRNLEASLKLLVRKKQLTQGNIEHVLQIIDKLKV